MQKTEKEMIPKTIHYCWFGRGPKPKLAQKCFRSWKRYARGYKIIEWNEDNFDIASSPLYVRQAYEMKKWAYVTDYVRLKVVYDHGGVYLDTDVELKKSLDPLLGHNAFFGYEAGTYIATGLGFGAVKGAPILEELMADYLEIPFVSEAGEIDMTTCPVRNTAVFLGHGLRQDDSEQVLDGNILILPTTYLCPYAYNMSLTGDLKKAYSIHWFSASWFDKASQNSRQEWLEQVKKDRLKHLPNRILMGLLGEKGYNRLKKMLNR